MEGISKFGTDTVPLSTSPANINTLHQRKRQHQDITRTIKELTSNKKRLSDSNLATNDTIEFFTKIKNGRIKTFSLAENPNFNKFNTYNPYDREKLLQRLNTYNILNWSIEDSNLTPLICARYGWICVESNGNLKKKNQIKCHTCNETIFIKLNDSNQSVSELDEEEDFDKEVNAELIKKYLTKISTDHNDSCPWKTHPSPLSSYLIQAYDYQDILTRLRKTIDDLNENKQYIKTKSYAKVVEDEQLDKLQKWTNFEFDNDILMIALLGWELIVQTFGHNKLIFLKCHCCNRRILLSDRETSKVNKHDKDPTLNSSPTKVSTVYSGITEEEDEGDDEVDLLDEHQDWCALKSGGYDTVLQFI